MIEEKQNTIRLVIVGSLNLFRASLGRFLTSAGFEVSECGGGAEALDLLKHSTVDVVLLDFDLPDPGEIILRARQADYQGRFLLIARTVDAQESAVVIKMGASGIFLESEPPERLIQAIHFIADGRIWIDEAVIQLLACELIERFPKPNLSGMSFLEDRERDVLRGIVAGLSNRRIGENISLSESSVKNVVQRLFHKAGVKTRSQLVRMALEGAFGTPDSIKSPRDAFPALG